MSRFVLALSVLLAGSAARAQNGPLLAGSVQGDQYTSATGVFRIGIPVSSVLGGTIADTPNTVTFADSFSTFITIVSFPLDPAEKWQMDTANSRKEYLLSFFTDHVLPDFRKTSPQLQVEPAGRYLPGVMEGAFLVYILLPGGSMFTEPEFQIAQAAAPPVAKRANLLFVRNGYIFVVSTELAERVTEGTAYHQSSDQEDQILRDRLVEIVSRMRFLQPPVAAAP